MSDSSSKGLKIYLSQHDRAMRKECIVRYYRKESLEEIKKIRINEEKEVIIAGNFN